MEKSEKSSNIREQWKNLQLPLKPGQFLGDFSSETPADSYSTLIRRKDRLILKALQNQKEDGLVLNEVHQNIYFSLQDQLQKPHLSAVRGGSTAILLRTDINGELHFIFQIRKSTPNLVRGLKKLLEWLQRQEWKIRSFHVLQTAVEVPMRFGFPPPKHELKSLFGSPMMLLPWDEKPVFCHVLEYFSPIRSEAYALAEHISQRIPKKLDYPVLDLYSGGGFLSLCLAARDMRVRCIDRKIESANTMQKNASRSHSHQSMVRHNIRDKQIPNWMNTEFSVAIYEAPSDRLDVSWIKAIARTTPQKVFAIYSELEKFSEDLKRWKRNGYILHKANPTNNSFNERILVELRPDSQGALQAGL